MDTVASTPAESMPATAPQSPLELLVESDRQLASLVAEVGDLERALRALRAEADRVEAALARRAEELEATARALAATEAERDRVRQLLEQASRELGEATAELRGRDGQVASLETELGTLRNEIAGRERGLTETAARLAAAEAALLGRERALQRDHTARRVGEAALAEAQQRADALADAAEEVAVERDRLARSLTELEQRLTEQDNALAEARLQAARGSVEAEAAIAERDRLRDVLAEREDPYADPAGASPRREAVPGHVRVLALPSGYAVTEHEESCPAVGEVVAVEGRHFTVAKLGRSPLPGDARVCAFVLPE
jgi:chromosome segregation ATPase